MIPSLSSWQDHLAYPFDEYFNIGFMEYCLELLSHRGKLSPKEISHFAENIRSYGKNTIMAKGKKNEQQTTGSGYKEFNWLSIEVTAADEDVLGATEWSDMEILDSVASVVARGYNISTKPDDRSSGVACFITCNVDGHRDNRYGLSGYGTTLREAVIVALFKLEDKCGGFMADYKPVARRFR